MTTPHTTDQRTYAVQGMSCAHCVAAVTREVGTVPGVEAVAVDLDAAQVHVRGAAEDAAIRAAITDAGYEVAA
jgi:copper ion binding protein